MSAAPRIVVFCGKGGVGKTTLALALGLKHAAAGRRVVVITSHPLPELAVSVSLEGLAERSPEAAANFFITHFDPKELLAEVVRKHFPVPMLANSILNSRIYQNLIEVAPGLKEFYFLLRLQSLAERKAPATGSEVVSYDLLLWDAPATGHFLGTLRAAKSFEAYLTGPLATAGAEVARFFSNASSISILPTTTLEEMAIDETSEMCRALDGEFKLPATAVLLNLVSPLASASESQVEELSRASQSSSDPALRFATERGLLERERAAALRTAIPAPMVPVERICRWSTDLDLLEQMGRHLEILPVAA